MNKSDHIFNKKHLKAKRKALRRSSTSAEATLWNLLKNRQIEGRKFRRQYSIESYIVDFCCPSENLVIELDGNYHGDYFQIEKDTERDQFLGNLGFTVLRFENRWVFQDPDYVLKEIKRIIIR